MTQTKMRKNIYYLKFIADVPNHKHEVDLITTILIVQEGKAEELHSTFIKTAIFEFKKLYGHDITSKDIQWKVISLIDSCDSVCDVNDIEFVVEHQSPVDGQYYWLMLHDSEIQYLGIYNKYSNEFYITDMGWVNIVELSKWFPQAVKRPSSNQFIPLTINK
jgi:hypothetical protein